MLTQDIAEKIQGKVSALVNQPLSIVEAAGSILASNDPAVDESLAVEDYLWAIDILYNNRPVGYVVLAREMPNHDEIAPLVRSIAELILHQSILIEQLPGQEERLDKFAYDLLCGQRDDERMMMAEARLFDIDLQKPRIAIVIYIDDPVLTGESQLTGIINIYDDGNAWFLEIYIKQSCLGHHHPFVVSLAA